jgi:hypothetical protein
MVIRERAGLLAPQARKLSPRVQECQVVPITLPAAAAPQPPTLVRAIGVRTLAASIINTTVGAGIFVLPAAVAAKIGAAAPLAYLVCALTMALIVTCFAMAGVCCAAAWELMRRDVRTGGSSFRVPAGGIVPPLACAAIAWILSHATALEFALLAAVLGIAVVLYVLQRARQTRAAE